MLNICKFQKYLGNSRKIISLNKEFKLWHLQNFLGKCKINSVIVDVLKFLSKISQLLF